MVNGITIYDKSVAFHAGNRYRYNFSSNAPNTILDKYVK